MTDSRSPTPRTPDEQPHEPRTPHKKHAEPLAPGKKRSQPRTPNEKRPQPLTTAREHGTAEAEFRVERRQDGGGHPEPPTSDTKRPQLPTPVEKHPQPPAPDEVHPQPPTLGDKHAEVQALDVKPHERDISGEKSEELEPPGFVLHDHRKPRPHFDLRLEMGGVLRSWALPRGLPTDSGRNRLAVAVPDHDLEHLTFTDANKFIADIGWWHEEDRNEKRFVFTLHGRGGACRYALIHTDGANWLLHLTKEQPTG